MQCRFVWLRVEREQRFHAERIIVSQHTCKCCNG